MAALQDIATNAPSDKVAAALKGFQLCLKSTKFTQSEIDALFVNIHLHTTLLNHPMSLDEYGEFVKAAPALLTKWAGGYTVSMTPLHMVPFMLPLQKFLTDWDNTGATLMRAYNQSAGDSRQSLFNQAACTFAHQLHWDTTSFSQWLKVLTKDRNNVDLSQFTGRVIKGLPIDVMPALRDILFSIGKPSLLPAATTFDTIFTIKDMSPTEVRINLRKWLQALPSWHSVAPVEHYLLDQYWSTLDWSVASFRTTGMDFNTLFARRNAAYDYLAPKMTQAFHPIAQHAPAEVMTWLYQALQNNRLSPSASFVKMVATLPLVLNTTDLAVTLERQPSTIITWLHNEAYPITQRLAWMEQYASALSSQSKLAEKLSTLPSPLKDMVILYAAMHYDEPRSGWRKALSKGLDSDIARNQFFATHAPALVGMYPAIRSLDLSCKDAMAYCLDCLSSGKTTDVALPLMEIACL